MSNWEGDGGRAWTKAEISEWGGDLPGTFDEQFIENIITAAV